MASADHDRDGDGIAQEFKRNLDTGLYAYAGKGNPYVCALMQRHDSTADRPLNELFGAWWLGAFCSDPERFVLIDNLAPYGIGSLLHMLVRGCGELQQDATKASHAALHFVSFLQARTPVVCAYGFAEAIAALEAVERLGPAGSRSGRYQTFLARLDEPDKA